MKASAANISCNFGLALSDSLCTPTKSAGQADHQPSDELRVVVFGNSGSGKSTLAKQLAAAYGLTHLDLDTLAWEPTEPPQRRPAEAVNRELDQFMNTHANWVIEGCYGELLKHVAEEATTAVFMDLSIERCQHNARNRPWEPHKYDSAAAQDANLTMLLDWIAAYEQRDDDFSRAAHQQLLDGFSGTTIVIDKNQTCMPEL